MLPGWPPFILRTPHQQERDMAINQYDAIVVGARCAGSPTAMLLARKGYKVLVVDRARFPALSGAPGTAQAGAEHAKVVVGADGRHSLVARAVQPEHYPQRPRLQVSYYGYWSDLPMAGRFETYLRPDRGFASPAEFFTEENVRRITLRAGAAAPA
jgi:flavin-dependent dehydrogenase